MGRRLHAVRVGGRCGEPAAPLSEGTGALRLSTQGRGGGTGPGVYRSRGEGEAGDRARGKVNVCRL